jgi:hypothetical protein
LSFLTHPPELSDSDQQTPGRESGEIWQEMALNFIDKVSLSYSAGFFKLPQNVRKGQWLYFPPEGSCAMDLKIHHLQPGFNP